MESEEPITGVCWTDRGLVISACGEVELWDAVKEAIIHPLPNHDGRCCALAFRGHRLATGGADGVINVSDLRTGTGSSLVGHHGEVAGLSWSQNCAHLASGGCDRRVMIWGDQQKRTYSFREPVQAVHYVNPSLLAIGVMDSGGTLAFAHGRQDELPVTVSTGAPITGIAFSDPWGLVVSHQKSFEWEIWSSELKRTAKYPGHTGDILNIALSEDGSLAATIGVDETLQLWEFRNGKAKTPGMAKRVPKSMSTAFPLR
jgi:WD40 repeat protein